MQPEARPMQPQVWQRQEESILVMQLLEAQLVIEAWDQFRRSLK
jgi:hypothetical protein